MQQRIKNAYREYSEATQKEELFTYSITSGLCKGDFSKIEKHFDELDKYYFDKLLQYLNYDRAREEADRSSYRRAGEENRSGERGARQNEEKVSKYNPLLSRRDGTDTAEYSFGNGGGRGSEREGIDDLFRDDEAEFDKITGNTEKSLEKVARTTEKLHQQALLGNSLRIMREYSSKSF